MTTLGCLHAFQAVHRQRRVPPDHRMDRTAPAYS